ncbi:hypothetical protein BUALT_Bualt01G0136500 [Buddleja alternifolia]|uniref:Uncharacterized protein n=1 Tax=Buddleja alternifolia TaxID=168488 RepID=A0AAV6YFF6_9LAMI|nr:hypothetical protein BUALT_Bualt01G0136500 [Buddleja alternifolia]
MVRSSSSVSGSVDCECRQGRLGDLYPERYRRLGLPSDSRLSSVITNGRWLWPCARSQITKHITAELPPIHEHSEDSIRWKHSSNGVFTVESAREILRDRAATVLWSHLLHGLEVLKQQVRFKWMGTTWRQGVDRASRLWRGKHLLNVANRILMASIVYYMAGKK